MSGLPNWSLCPNDPSCGHGAVLHDVEDLDDTWPRCCVADCECGQRTPCPYGCGDNTDDPYGGPCSACWRALDRGWDDD